MKSLFLASQTRPIPRAAAPGSRSAVWMPSWKRRTIVSATPVARSKRSRTWVLHLSWPSRTFRRITSPTTFSLFQEPGNLPQADGFSQSTPMARPGPRPRRPDFHSLGIGRRTGHGQFGGVSKGRSRRRWQFPCALFPARVAASWSKGHQRAARLEVGEELRILVELNNPATRLAVPLLTEYRRLPDDRLGTPLPRGRPDKMCSLCPGAFPPESPASMRTAHP